ncbi:MULTISPECIES: DNA adenine methylase [Halorussus]|uniref:DNA adenine methylase n=1 Tax=Halorussus TaxID=1070314 RepID=UPI0020A167DC|nr:DNA adenine methylase [Halorussus vallis]USZ74059.1 DNA adenine methylase [Halorussus vallis]
MSDHEQMRFDVSGEETSFYSTVDADFPTTRYQGSKRKLSSWIWENLGRVEFDSMLDPFGGTGAISFEAKKHGKQVFYNDFLRFNHQIGLALIENNGARLTDEDVNWLLEEHDFDYPSLVQDEFDDLYYTDDENEWLDRMRVNIDKLDNEYKRAIANSAVSQAALAKRPYNLFHRANLYMRTQDVERSFGNKTTWEKPFDEHFRNVVDEFNAAVFDNERENASYNEDVLNWENPPEADLVYLDPPYYDRTKQNGETPYRFYYHFLEGWLQYDDWPDLIDDSVKTKRLQRNPSQWTDPDAVYNAFEKTFEKFSDSHIALSYNTAGLPTPKELKNMLEYHKSNVVVEAKEHQYALSTSEDSADEIIFVAYD